LSKKTSWQKYKLTLNEFKLIMFARVIRETVATQKTRIQYV